VRTFDEIKTQIERFRDNGWSGETYARQQLTLAAETLQGVVENRREPLPNARFGITFDVAARGMSFTATVGFYPDGRPAELFLNAHKQSTDVDHDARDMAILASFALQHGAKLHELAKAMTRDAEGRPQGIAGHALDAMLEVCR
jgi:hypothetical protein